MVHRLVFPNTGEIQTNEVVEEEFGNCLTATVKTRLHFNLIALVQHWVFRNRTYIRFIYTKENCSTKKLQRTYRARI